MMFGRFLTTMCSPEFTFNAGRVYKFTSKTFYDSLVKDRIIEVVEPNPKLKFAVCDYEPKKNNSPSVPASKLS